MIRNLYKRMADLETDTHLDDQACDRQAAILDAILEAYARGVTSGIILSLGLYLLVKLVLAICGGST